MPQPRILTLQDYAAMLRRRWYLAVFPMIVGLALGYAALRVLPKRYTSRTLMLVEQQQVPHDFVQPVITEDLNARVANIEEQTLSRTRLQPLIERYSLFSKDAAQHSIDDLVLRLQRVIELTPITPVVTSAQDQTIPGFYLSVTLADPHKAQEVCNDLASMFIDEDIRQRQRSAEGTTNFLQSQLDDAKRNLDLQDENLAAFERKYMGALPDETKTNLTMLGTLNTQLQAATENLNRAVQDKAYMESVLAQQLQAWKLTQEMRAGFVPGQPANPLARRLTELQEQLAGLQVRYTDKFPDVIKVKAEIEDLKQEIAKNTASATGKDTQTKGAPPALEPVQLQKLRSQLLALNETIRIDAAEQQQLKNQVSVYESRLQLSPTVEEEYKKITRDHDSALKFYNNLLSRRDESEMATDLERRQEGQQLRVMDPANLPDKPSFPKPSMLIGGGFAGGLALGLIGIFALERSDKRIRTERDVQYYLGASAFALIPSIEVAAIKQVKGSNGSAVKRLVNS